MFQTINFATPNVIFGIDAIEQVGVEAKKLNVKKALVITGPNVKKAGNADRILNLLQESGIETVLEIEKRTTSEPTTAIAEEMSRIAKEEKVDCVIGIGGGSVLDVAKMASALVINPLRVRDYFGKERLPQRGIPTIMIPTTAGTGAELTKHAIFLDEETNVKKAVASSNLLPSVAIIDPMLTLSCPQSVTAASGIDAFLHAAEPFVSKAANPITDQLALTAVSLISKWLGPAFADGSNLEARYYMSLGSTLAGMVLNNAGTSLVHALAYPIGGEYHVNHGRSLTPILLSCLDAIRVAKQDKFVELAKAMGEPVDGLSPHEAADRFLAALRELMLRVDLPICLEDLGINDRSHVDQWAVDGYAERRLLARSARDLSVEDIKKIYLNAFSR